MCYKVIIFKNILSFKSVIYSVIFYISPIIIGDLPINACIIANNNLTTRIVANAGCSTETVTDIQILYSAGISSSNLGQLTNSTWYKNMTWSPPLPIVGVNQYLICSIAYNSALLVSSSSCYTFITGLTNPKVFYIIIIIIIALYDQFII